MGKSLQEILNTHSSVYREMELSDYVKLIYQNELGSGHMISNTADSERFLKTEYKKVLEKKIKPVGASFIEEIGNGLCRMHLDPEVIKPEDLSLINLLFTATANMYHGSITEFKNKISVLYELADKKILPLKAEDIQDYANKYYSKGCPAVHHSETYRLKYQPHYRVVKIDYAFYYPVFQAVHRLIERGRSAVIAIDGRCGSGKSRLARLLSEVFACNVFHMDDFFLPPWKRTEKRLSEPGGNVDYERFMEEVLKPLLGGQDVRFHPFDCRTGELNPAVHKKMRFLSIVEGSYSHHRFFGNNYDLRVFLTCSPEIQKRRILMREGEDMLERFVKEWIPLEEYYFKAFKVKENCDLEVDTTGF